jgi:hypothetical protein
MALRDRQISGIPLTKSQAAIVALLMTGLIPVLSYGVWFRTFLTWVPAELRVPIVVVGMIIHLTLSVQVVPNNVERNLLWFGSYTGASFPNGICLLPRLPIPFVLFLLRLFLSEEIYGKILWSLAGDVPVKSIILSFYAEGMTREKGGDGIRTGIPGKLRVEVENAATYLSQDLQVIMDGVVAEYIAGVKSSVISQHSFEELIRGYHSGGASTLVQWMTEAWNLVGVYGVRLESAMINQPVILNKQVEHAFDRAHAKETFIAGAKSLAETYAAFKEALPPGTSEEVALAMFNADRIDSGQSPVSINIVKFK